MTTHSCPPSLRSASTVGSFNRQCLSCDLVDNCTYFSASFSPGADFFLLKCEGEFPPLPVRASFIAAAGTRQVPRPRSSRTPRTDLGSPSNVPGSPLSGALLMFYIL